MKLKIAPKKKKDRLMLWMFRTLYDESMFCQSIEILFNYVWKLNKNLFFNILYHITNYFKPIKIIHSWDLAKWYGILLNFYDNGMVWHFKLFVDFQQMPERVSLFF